MDTHTHTAIVSAADFTRAITNAALFASADDTLPGLVAIHLTPGDKGRLMLEATNRYIAAREEIDLIDPAAYDSDWTADQIVAHLADAHDTPRPTGLGVSAGYTTAQADHDAKHAAGADHEHTVRPVPETTLDVVADVKQLTLIAKTVKQVAAQASPYAEPAPMVTITWDDSDPHVQVKLGGGGIPDMTMEADRRDSPFPRIGAIFTDHRAKGTSKNAPAGWDIAVQWLATLAKVDDGTKPKDRVARLAFDYAAGKPVKVTIGPRFTAMVIPMRPAETGEEATT